MSKPVDPWSYSDKVGRLLSGGKIRIYGFSQPPEEPLSEAVAAGGSPIEIELEPGRYAWCTCGHSKTQPFCDNEHREQPTNRKSYKFEVLEKTSASFCMCKRTRKPPFCDGSHEQCYSDGRNY